MATFTKLALSASTNGRPIKVGATGTPGTLIHTAVTGTSDFDEIWIYAMNSDTTDRKLTLEWGGVSVPDDLVEHTIIAESGLTLLVPGFPLQNTLLVRAFAATTNVITIHGFVNRITA
jgi:hypothetical protein